MSTSRQYPERPIVGVGVVVWRGDHVLLARRGKPPRAGDWSLPGGAQKVGETVHAAARREVLEETGLEIKVLGLVDVVDSITRDSGDGGGEGRIRYHYTLVDLVAEAGDGEATARDDVAAVGWFPMDQIDGLGLWSETVRIIRLAQEKRAGYRSRNA